MRAEGQFPKFEYLELKAAIRSKAVANRNVFNDTSSMANLTHCGGRGGGVFVRPVVRYKSVGDYVVSVIAQLRRALG